MKLDNALPRGVLVVLFTSALFTSGCDVGVDAGPTQTAVKQIDIGNAESTRAEIHMNSGELHLSGGAPGLLDASFRYSQQIGQPEVHYQVTGGHGVLTLDSPKTNTTFRNKVNEWTLRMGSKAPLDLNVNLGAGTSDIDVSGLTIHSIGIHMGAGEMKLNLAGKYPKDVSAEVEGGAGEAIITLPKDMGAVVDAKVGIGGVNVSGLQKRDGKYYNDAYVEGMPALRLDVRGGVGDITLKVAQ
jgi:hypothetical protein